MIIVMGCLGVPGGHADEPAGDRSGGTSGGAAVPEDINDGAGANTVLSAPIRSLEDEISPDAGEENLVFSEPEDAIILGEAVPGPSAAPGPSAFVVLRMVLVLALAAAAIYGVVFFLRRAARPQEASNNPYLKILTSAHLGSNRFVYVVALGSRAWLVGAGEGGVSLIAEVTDQETVDAMLLDSSARGGERAGSFRALLRRLGGGFVPGKGDPSGELADTLRKNRERLRGL